MPMPQFRAPDCESYFTAKPTSLLRHTSKTTGDASGSCYPCGRLRLHSSLLALAWLRSGCVQTVVEWTGSWKINLSLPSILFPLSQIKINNSICFQKSTTLSLRKKTFPSWLWCKSRTNIHLAWWTGSSLIGLQWCYIVRSLTFSPNTEAVLPPFHHEENHRSRQTDPAQVQGWHSGT